MWARGFRVRDVASDGSCMPRAVLESMGRSQDGHHELRRAAVDAVRRQMIACPDEAQVLIADAFLDASGALPDLTPDQYWAVAIKDNFYLASSELRAMATFLDVHFHVYSSTLACDFSGPTVIGSGPRTVPLLYVNNNHYMAVLSDAESGGSKPPWTQVGGVR